MTDQVQVGRTGIVLLPEAEAAAELRISARTLRDLRSKGKIRYVRPSPRKVGYRVDDLVEYLNRNTFQETPPRSTSNSRKVHGASTPGSKVSAFTEALAVRPGGMSKGSKRFADPRARRSDAD